MSIRRWFPLGVSLVLLLAAARLAPAEEAGPGADQDADPWTDETPVGMIVAERPATARIFELVGIDYCCGGRRSLSEAAAGSKVDPERLLAALLVVGQTASGADARDWTRASVDELIEHIEATHHAYLRRELPRIELLLRRVVHVHAAAHPDLKPVQSTFLSLSEELVRHLALEEETVFPMLRREARGEAAPRIAGQRDALLTQHDAAAAALHRLRSLTRDFEPPADACPSYRQLLTALEGLEADLHRHVHLENNVLLAPRPSR